VPHPDPLVRGMDPRFRIRIWIRIKISWIRNTGAVFSMLLLGFHVMLLFPSGFSYLVCQSRARFWGVKRMRVWTILLIFDRNCLINLMGRYGT
jgi:hypothetical protein